MNLNIKAAKPLFTAALLLTCTSFPTFLHAQQVIDGSTGQPMPMPNGQIDNSPGPVQITSQPQPSPTPQQDPQPAPQQDPQPANGQADNNAGQDMGSVQPNIQNSPGPVQIAPQPQPQQPAPQQDPQPAPQQDPTPVSHITPETIDNDSGQAIATISSNGQIDNANGQDIGTLQSNGQIVSPSGQDMGSVQSNGQIVNASGQVLFTVENNGDIFNDAGQKIGTVQNYGTSDSEGNENNNSGQTTVIFDGDYPETGQLVENSGGLYLDNQSGQRIKLATSGREETRRINELYYQNNRIRNVGGQNTGSAIILTGRGNFRSQPREKLSSASFSEEKRSDWPSCAENGNIMLMTWNGPIALGSLSHHGVISLFKNGKIFANVGKVTPEGHLTKEYDKYDNIRLDIDRQIISLLERFDFIARIDGKGNLWHCGAHNAKNHSQKAAYILEPNGHFKCRTEGEKEMHPCGEIKKEDMNLLH
ncbi:hypothetical protein FAI41_03745 [Acetobacteraceae bacterium]|nr:hypothetical protein FAI41_03745 [Acetobacteraceae bacterium]